MAKVVIANAQIQMINWLISERSLDDYYKYDLKPEMFGNQKDLMIKIIKFTEEYGETPVLDTVLEWDKEFYDCLDINDPAILAKQLQVDYFYTHEFQVQINKTINNAQLNPEEAMREVVEFAMKNLDIIYDEEGWDIKTLNESLEDEEDEPPVIIPNMLTHGGVSMISGYEGLGKSIVALKLAKSIAEGDYPFDNCEKNTKIWKKSTKQNILYISLEGNVRGKCKTYNIKSDNIIILEADSFKDNFDILNSSIWNRIVSLCIKRDIKVIIIDPLYLAISNKGLLDPDKVREVVKRCNKLYRDNKISTILIHHNTISADGDKSKSPKSAGSSYLEWGLCDHWTMLKPPKDLEDEIIQEQQEYLNDGKNPPQYALLQRRKSRYGNRLFDNLIVKFDRENRAITSKIYTQDRTSIKNATGRKNGSTKDSLIRETLNVIDDYIGKGIYKVSKKEVGTKVCQIMTAIGLEINYDSFKNHYAKDIYESIKKTNKISNMDKNNLYLNTDKDKDKDVF